MTKLSGVKYFTDHIVVGGVSVLDGSKPSQTILIDIDLERITRRHQDIDTEVKLETIDKEGL